MLLLPDLFDFAYVPSWYDQLDILAGMALPESWRFRNPAYPPKNTDTPILEKYIHYVFKKQVIDFNSEPNPEFADMLFHLRNETACFHTGLYTRGNFKSIYGCFTRNKKKDSMLDWYFRGFADEASTLTRFIQPLPQRPAYLLPISGMNYFPEWDIRVNVTHKLYALGALEEFGNLYDISEVRMTIFQPRRENVSTWSVSVPDLLTWANDTLRPKAVLAFKGEGEFTPGEWCVFCKAAVKCRARAGEKLRLAKYEFALPPLLTDAEVEDILGRLYDLTRWANDIVAYATDAALNHGKEWSGFKLVEGRSARKYKDEAAVALAARKAGYADIYKKSLIPLTEMERLMGRTQFAEVLGAYIEKPLGKPTLVPDSDRRPPLNTSTAQQDFKEDFPNE